MSIQLVPMKMTARNIRRRRGFCDNMFLLPISLILFLGNPIIAQKPQEALKPNFLVIIADDAGWNDVGYNGSEIHTPNIDLLAKTSVRLDRFYVNPTCSPTRAGFLTGMPASRMGIVAPIAGRSEKKLPDSVITLPQQLRKGNYQTALFGKWHLGLKPASGPKVYGFDYAYGFLHGQIDQYSHEYKNGDPSWHRNGEFVNENGHATDLIGQEAMTWLRSKRDKTKSFYVQLAYSAPHYPLQEEERWKKPYLKSIENESRRDFAAAMTHMDDNIGQILKTLKELDLDKNTVVIFMSDNGGMPSWYPKNQYNGKHGPNSVLGNNLPLRDWKKSNYEGGIRVPAIISWKGKLAPAVNTGYISVVDVMPTFLELSGATSIPKTVEGKSIWPSLVSGDTWSNEIYVRGHLQESLTKKPWKLIRTRHRGGVPTDFELYNLEIDPEEKDNVYTDEVTIAKDLSERLQKQFAKDAPTVNAGIN